MKATKHYLNERIYVEIERDPEAPVEVITFESEKEMRTLGECLVDLARIGGQTVEIKTYR